MKQVLLLRGINLGKKNKVPMSDLRDFLSSFGFTNIKTYIQTGNISVEHDEHIDIPSLEVALEQRYGFSIPVITRSLKELEEICQHPLFTKEQVMVIFCKDTSKYDTIKSLINEEHVLYKNNVIIRYSTSYHKTKFTNNWFEKHLQTQATLRNKNTILKMIDRFK